MDKNKWISAKIRELEHENKGRSHEQNIAIAFSMFENIKKAQQGIEVPSTISPKTSYQDYTNEIINPITAVKKVGEEGYEVYYGDPNDPNADKVFFTNTEFDMKRNYKSYPNNPVFNKEPYLQQYLTQTKGRIGDVVVPKGQQGGKIYAQQGVTTPLGYPDYNQVIQGQMLTPQQDFSVQNQDKLRNYFTPAQMPSANTQVAAVQDNSLPQTNSYPTPTMQRADVNDINLSIDGQTAPSGLSPQEYAGTLQGAMTTPYGESLRQEVAGETPTQTKKQPLTQEQWTQLQLLNPYGGGMSLEGSLAYAGKSFGEGNTAQGLMGTGLSLLKGARAGLSGYAAGKVNREGYEQYRANQFAEPNYTYAQQGGEITNSQALTGAYLTENPNTVPNVNLERNEFVANADSGQIQKVVGETHKKGGVDATLAPGSKVLSDYTKVGAKNAKEFKEEFDIEVKASDTFAKILDKYNKKIGWDKLLKEEEELLKSIEKAQDKGDEKTKNVNLEFLSTKYKTLLDKKGMLQTLQDEAFHEMFEAQEKFEKKGDGTQLLDDNGNIIEEKKYGGEIEELAKKYNISPDRVHEIMMQEGGTTQQNPQDQIMNEIVGMLQQGATPDEVITTLIQNGVEHEMAMQMVDSIMSQMQGSQEQIPMAQEGGIQSLNQWVEQRAIKPEYEYGDISQTAERFKEIADTYGIPYTEKDLTTQQGLDSLAGRIQQSGYKDTPSLVEDYGLSVEPTRQGLQYLIDNKIINAKDYNIKLQNGKVTRGSYDTLEEDTQNKIQQKLKALPAEQKKEYANKNYLDNQAYFRAIERKKFTLPEEEYNKYVEANKDKLVGDGYFKTDKQGVYVQVEKSPQGTSSVAPATKETPTAPVTNQGIIQEQPTTKYAVPLLPQDYIMPPSSAMPVYKGQVNLGRIEPIKATTEPYLAEQQRQVLAVQAANAQSLTPEMAAVANAMALGQSQQAANQAIGQVEQQNTAQQYAADQFNLGQADKEQITNLGLAQKYQDQMYATLNNTDRDWRRYFNQVNAQNRQNYRDVSNLQLTNALYPDYQFDGSQVQFSNRPITSAQTKQQAADNKAMLDFYKKLTPTQQAEFQKKATQTGNA